MKKTVLVAVFITCVHLCGSSQNVTLLTQNDVDAFPTNYPGVTSLTSLEIYSATITNLDALSQITEVTGNLTISSPTTVNNVLTNINGLNNVTAIGGMLTLDGLHYIDATNLFPSLTTLGAGGANNGLKIQGACPTSLMGFNSLHHIFGNLMVVNTTNLVSVDGFHSLLSIQTNTSNPSNFQFQNNVHLVSITGFSALTEIGSTYFIDSNPTLTSLPTIPTLTKIGSALIISLNPNLLTLIPLQSITTITKGMIFINNNTSLESLAGLENITLCNGIIISSNPMLSDLSALGNVTSFNPAPLSNRPVFTIRNNAILSDLTGLENIAGSTIGNVIIQNNPNLSNCAIESLCEKIAFDASLSGFVTITNNSGDCTSASAISASCEALQTFDFTEVTDITIFPNPVQTLLTLSPISPKNTVMIVDVLGRTRQCNMIGENSIDVSGLEPGVYSIRISTEQSIYNTKFIKI
jgi:hypothetical protein